jgi:hypothetical protein
MFIKAETVTHDLELEKVEAQKRGKKRLNDFELNLLHNDSYNMLIHDDLSFNSIA